MPIAALIRQMCANVRGHVGALHTHVVQQRAARLAVMAQTVHSPARRILQPQLFGRRDRRDQLKVPVAIVAGSEEPTTIRVESRFAAALFIDRAGCWPARCDGIDG